MKKWCALFLAAALITATLTGCTVDGQGSGDSVEKSEESQDAGSENETVTESKTEGNFKIGIAAREITNDYNRGVVTASQEAVEAAGGSVVIADAQAEA